MSGATSASFVYDGDGNRVKSVMGGVTTTYIGAHFEWTGFESTMVKYYYAGGQRVAMRKGSTLTWLLGDHLGSTAITANSNGTLATEQRYYPWGATRYGSSPTAFQYTGQRNDSSIGLYFYNARYYDPALGRFLQADTIIPSFADPQSLNRYSYTLNNPLKYSDPDGHIVLAIGLILLAAGTAGIIDWGLQVKGNADQGMSFWDATSHHNVDLGQSAKTAVEVGAVATLVVTAAPVVVSAVGQGLMGGGMLVGSSTLWNAGMATTAAGITLDAALWGTTEVSYGKLPADTRPNVIEEPETISPHPVRPANVTSEWDDFLGEGPYTNIHPRTSMIDNDRLVSPDGARSIRYGAHEMNSSKHHYHEEIWSLDPFNIMHVTNTIRRIAPK